MELYNDLGQAMSDEQRLKALRRRISVKAEDLVNSKKPLKIEAKHRWIVIATWGVLLALLVWIEYESYVNNVFWSFNIKLFAFILIYLIVDFIMAKIMRLILTRMDNAGPDSQYYRAVKWLVRTHKLRCLIPAAVAFICMLLIEHGYGSDFWANSFLFFWSLLGAIWGASMRNWNLDEDFCDDIEDLEYLITMNK